MNNTRNQEPHVLAIYNQKGGVGKTAITINLGAILADMGYRVLLIDLDPHGHLTEGIGLQEAFYPDDDEPTLFQIMVEGKGRIRDVITKAPNDEFYVIPSAYDMSLAERELTLARNKEHKLKKIMHEISTELNFDWILIDCPPLFGNLSDNALNAARKVLVPIEANHQSVRALNLLLDQIELFERGLDIRVEIVAILPNKVVQSGVAEEVLTKLHENVGAALAPFNLRKRVVLEDAWGKGVSISKYEADTQARKQAKEDVVADYRQLANYLIERFGR